MFNEVVKEINWGGKTLTIKTGKVARQSDGAVMISMGETVVLCTAVSAREVRDGIGFFPLTVHYREMAFAAGKIPGGFFKREGRSSDREILICRLIDRPIRPLFHPSFFNETQIICTVLSYDPACNPDILAMIGSSAALALSGVPFMEIIGAARVGHIDGNFVLNPSCDEVKNSRLDLVVAATDSSVMMVESEADQLSEVEMLDAVEFGHNALRPVIQMINELVKAAGKPRWALPTPIASDDVISDISKRYSAKITEAFAIKAKQERMNALGAIHTAIKEDYSDKENITSLHIEFAFDEVKSRVLRASVLETGKRIDGRKTTDIRQIECETSILPKTHGSALFTRGETQGLVVTTLGTTQDEQIVDGIIGDARDRFMLQYIFPPYSVGEATPLRAPGRREVGHGKLAWRALNPVLPTKDEFPYSLRVVSEITECNGSSSMATVCGSSLAMMDAGVPLKAAVSGIAMGLIKEGDKFTILSDILGDEDYLGDMDFKVAGTSGGITALQMDIKVTGITLEIMKQALSQAHDGRMHILEQMAKALSSHKTEVNQYAPIIKSFKVNKDKIREIIGPGGKVIKDICEKTGAKIDINDDGKVEVSAVGLENLNNAVGMIMAIAAEPEVGQIFDGTVVKVLESGAFINYMPGRDGFIHISEIADERIDNINSHLEMDKVVKVKIIGVDHKGKAKLSMRLDAVHHAEPPRRPERSDGERSGGPRKFDNKERREPRREKQDESHEKKKHGTGSTERKHFN